MYLDDHIRNTTELSSTIKHFLLTLATYADHRGVCYPSQSTLATAMSMSRSSVQRCLKACLELRLLEVKRKWRKSNVYKLLCCKELKLSTMASSKEAREQPPFVQKRLTGKVVGSWKSPRDSDHPGGCDRGIRRGRRCQKSRLALENSSGRG